MAAFQIFKNKNISRLVGSLGHRNYCQGSRAPFLPVLTLFTKEECQLCDEAMEKLSPFLHQVQLETIDIEDEGREAEFDKFRYEIPVFFFNKKFLCKNHIDLDKFHEAVRLYKNKK